MSGRSYCFAGLLLLGAPPYSCHKPTLQESYADAKHCSSVYSAGLKLIDGAAFAQAQLDPRLVEDAKNNSVSAAYVDGKQLGMSADAIGKDLDRSRAAYLASHTGGLDAAQKMASLRADMNNCLGDYYGRPND